MNPIRRATSADLEGVKALVEEAYSLYIVRIGRKPGPMLDDYAALISDGLVSVIDPESPEDRAGPVAMIVLVPEEHTMLLDNVAVASRVRGQGYGRVMLEFAEKSAIERGFSSIRLYTHETMIENIALYGRVGYRETHRGTENGLNRVYMTKTLVPLRS